MKIKHLLILSTAVLPLMYSCSGYEDFTGMKFGNGTSNVDPDPEPDPDPEDPSESTDPTLEDVKTMLVLRMLTTICRSTTGQLAASGTSPTCMTPR
ncbi:MAG: hypothetical protein LIP09_16105 [Bacteroidales bacterium]|nr:hypothetical protein [Bacteroidales bacterium]